MIAMQRERPPVSAPAGAVCLLLLSVLVAGCRRGAPAGGEAGAGADSPFGDPYQVVLGYHPAEAEQPPALVGDTLAALVTYAGGCQDHAFALDYEVARDTARLWLRHDAGGDDCEGLVEDSVHVPVPDDVLEAPVVVLLNPSDPLPFVLRWRTGRAE